MAGQIPSVVQPDALSGLYLWLRSDDAGSTDGDAVATWSDRSGNGYDVTQATASAQPTFRTGILDGHPAVRFDGNDSLKAASAADWKFLHDGSEYRMIVVWRTRLAATDSAQFVLATQEGTSSQVGMVLSYDDRSAFAFDEEHRFRIGKGTSGSVVLDSSATERSCWGARWHIHHVSFNSDGGNLVSQVDGRWGDAVMGTGLTTFSSANPFGALTLGDAPATSIAPLDGDIVEVIIYNSIDHTERQFRGLEQYLLQRYPSINYFLPYETHYEVVADGVHNAFGGMTVASNGNFIAGYRKGSAHGSADGETYIRIARTPSRLADATEVAVNSDSSTDYREVAFTTLANNDVLMSYTARNSDGSLRTQGPEFKLSSDHGDNWGSAILPPAVFTEFTIGGMHALEVAPDHLLCPVYGRNLGDATNRRSVGLIESTDGGSSWSTLATIADGPGDGRDYNECGLALQSSGTVVAVIREEIGEDWYTATSSDTGATWTAPTKRVDSAIARPAFVTLDNDLIVGAIRDRGVALDVGRWATSEDVGVSWQEGEELERPHLTPDFYGYGQPVIDLDGNLWMIYFQERTDFVGDGWVLGPFLVSGRRPVVGFVGWR